MASLTREYFIDGPRGGIMATWLATLGLGHVRILTAGSTRDIDPLDDVFIVRADGQEEQVLKPGKWIEIRPGDGIRRGDNLVRLVGQSHHTG